MLQAHARPTRRRDTGPFRSARKPKVRYIIVIFSYAFPDLRYAECGLFSCVERYGACPEDLTEESSLTELLSSEDLYSQEPKNPASFSWWGLRLLKHKIRQKNAFEF